jgi:Spy/CpxP family protein refolding chaperone
MMDPSEMVIAPDVYKLNLTEDQKTKLEALKNEYAPKLKAGFEKHTSILTDEQRKARQDAVKAAKEAGKTRQEVWKEAQAAVKLTDAQKAQMDKAREEGQTLRKEIHEKVMAVLTPEQREQLKKERQQHRGPKQAEPQKTT